MYSIFRIVNVFDEFRLKRRNKTRFISIISNYETSILYITRLLKKAKSYET